MNADEPVGIVKGQRPQENGFDDGEGCGHASDAEREREDSGERESRRFTQLPQSETGVLEKTLEERKGAAFAVGLSCLFHAAEPDQGIAARLLGGHAGAEIIVDMHLEMGFQLGGKVIVTSLTKE
jgi:hypothetical protein